MQYSASADRAPADRFSLAEIRRIDLFFLLDVQIGRDGGLEDAGPLLGQLEEQAQRGCRNLRDGVGQAESTNRNA